MPNAINWFEIPVTDMNRAKKFYETVFDIAMTDLDLGNGLLMALFQNEADAVSGALCLHPAFYFPGNQGPLIYLNANPSIQEKLDRVIASGGKILKTMTMITEEYGSMSVIEDTEGNRIAMHSNE
ncbi:MAG TPA: VOC family protein [Saprospiraceae bacterium]|nr:VOC family protein [Saprospiraceae bacterium]